MAIFPYIELKSTVEQVNDRLRIDVSKSFADKSEAAISNIEVEADTGSGYISVFDSKQSNWFLDWEYATAGTKTVGCRVTTDGSPTIRTIQLEVLSSADDKLFSDDSDLVLIETDILKYVPEGRNSFKYVHRLAQTQILEDLYRIGVTNTSGDKLTKDAVVDIEEVRQWSRFLAMQFIFLDVSNAIGDIFQQKSDIYKSWALESRHKAIMKLDLNGDGNLDSTEDLDITWRRLRRI